MIEPPRPAVFLDKDGTLVDDVPYNADPSRIALLPGVLLGALALASAGYRLIVVSNQPGVALGMFKRDALARVEARIRELFGAVGVEIDGFYWCPHAPESAGKRRAGCACRKPRPGLLLAAAEAHRVDLARSWMIGDILDDVEAGHRAGCRSILVDRGSETCWQAGEYRTPDAIVGQFDDAVRVILDAEQHAQHAARAIAQTVH
jgi:histidinol-phosphate phosphatase family protein